jgi:hypothetical protein
MKKEFTIVIISFVMITLSFAGCTNQEKSLKHLVINSPSFVNESENFEVFITVNGTPMSNVNVVFAKQTKVTDSSGKVQFLAPYVSTSTIFNITAQKVGYQENTSSIMVWRIPQLLIEAPGNVTAGQQFSITVADDHGWSITGATVTFNGNVYTTVTGSTTLIAPMQKGNYIITAEFSGYRNTTILITVT